MSEKAETLVDAVIHDSFGRKDPRRARASLLAYITELEQDAARLDWLEREMDEVERLTAMWYVEGEGADVYGETIREAIDNAIDTSVRATRDEQKEGAV